MKRLFFIFSGVIWSLYMYVGMTWGKLMARHWPEGVPTNCFLWSAKKHQEEGGSLVMVNSHYGNWYHCYHVAPDGEATEYAPLHRKHRSVRLGIPPPVFSGRVRRVEKPCGSS